MSDHRWLTALLLCLPLTSVSRAQEPLRVYLRAGEKTHGPGQHDHPRFLADWTTLLTERGCEVEGSLEFPDRAALERADVLVLYAAEGASIHGEQRADLEAFLGRGGGLVVLHDAVCGDDPHWFKTVAGGAWEHGRARWLEGEIGLYFQDEDHPVTRGVSNFDLDDEIYHALHIDPAAHVLATSFHTPFDVTPQMWTLEKDGYRSFVSLQGHNHATFSHPAWRTLILRGIAWAARRDADLLTEEAEVRGLRYPPGGAPAPEVAHETLVTPPEFRAELVAAEPLVVNPIAIDWDAAGRAFVALTPGYPYKEQFSGEPAFDRIVTLVDDDGDGRADRAPVFYEGLDLVTGLIVHRDGVLVSQSPEILWLRDTDGDGAADERMVVFQGFGYGDTHATISNLRRGVDGWIYATQGYSGGASRHVTNAAGADFGHIGNGLFRFQADGSAIEMVVSYGSNTWGCDFTAEEELFFTMANGSHLRHVVMRDDQLAAGRLAGTAAWRDVTDHSQAFPLSQRLRTPYKQIDFVGGFTAAAGSVFYNGGAWPAAYRGDHFVCEPTINLVHRDRIEREGNVFRASKPREAEFLASANLWFRPVDARVGPDGALYVLDFCNQAAVHNDTRGPVHGPTNAAVRPDRDRQHGRIWRVDCVAARTLAQPELRRAGPRELVATLSHPNRWQRLTAQRLLLEEKPQDATLALLVECAQAAPEPEARIHALWSVARTSGNAFLRLTPVLLRDPEEPVRRNALWAAATLSERHLERLRHSLVDSIDERDARTRLAAVLALHGANDREVRTRLVARFAHEEDAAVRSAILSVAAANPKTYAAACLLEPAQGAGDLLVALATDVGRRRDLEQATGLLFACSDHRTAPAERLAACLRALTAALGDAPAPWPSQTITSRLRTFVASEDLDLALAALPLAVRWEPSAALRVEIEELARRLRARVEDPDVDLPRRLEALRTMLRVPDQRALAIEAAGRFLDPYFAPEVQLEVITALGAVDEVEAARILLAGYPVLAQRAREAAQEQLLRRAAWAEELLAAVERADLAPTDLGPQGVHRLTYHPEPTVAARAAALFARTTPARAEMDALIARLLPEVERPGDADHGRAVFQKNCANCHAIEGLETKGGVGPELTGMGAHGARELLPFLLDPNRSVEAAYLEYAVRTLDGRLLDGVVKRETADQIVLANASGIQEVRRDEVDEMWSTGRSPMPTGFEQLGAEALRDLMAFLAGDYGDFRLVDLSPVLNSSTSAGIYDRARDAKPMRFRRHGVVEVEGVPFEIHDPAASPNQNNLLSLKGGMAADWESKLTFPQRVVVELGQPVLRLHVLGGIAAWGYPFTQRKQPICRVTWHYADGASEEAVLYDGLQFADWIGRRDVPGSRYVDVTEPGLGQVRMFHLDPRRPGEVVERLTLESFDDHTSPTFVALTAQVAGEPIQVVEATSFEEARVDAASLAAAEVVLFGGGSSHDYPRWFDREARAALDEPGDLGTSAYTERPDELLARLASAEVVVLSNNQPLPEAALRQGLFDFVEAGGGLVLLHAATWFNWADWPEYNRELVGGGARGHESYGDFVVNLTGEHPLTEGVPRSFTIRDELYRFEAQGPAPEALATGTGLASGASYPVLWTRTLGAGRIVALTLGHDGAAHELPAFRRMLQNAVRWARD